MNETADLFEFPAIVRKRDPQTSKVAAVTYTKEKRKKDRDMLYDLIFENPGCTAGELADILVRRGEHWYRASRLPTKRISELKADGRLIAGPPRRCRITNHYAHVYYARPD